MSINRTPTEITEAYAQAGAQKGNFAFQKLVYLGLLAGILIAFGCAATNTAVYGIAQPWIGRTVCGLLFPFGLAMVIAMGGELFTGNCLMVISAFEHRCSMTKVLRNWVIVYFANMIGSVAIAALCAFFGQMNYSDGQLAVYTMSVAANKCALPFVNAVVSGFFCNFLVCLGVLMAFYAKDAVGKILGPFLPVCYFVLSGFEHCVANMYYIPAGLFAKMVPSYAALAAEAGVNLSALSWFRFFAGNLLPVTMGNILGGIAISFIMWRCYLKNTADVPVADSTCSVCRQ